MSTNEVTYPPPPGPPPASAGSDGATNPPSYAPPPGSPPHSLQPGQPASYQPDSEANAPSLALNSSDIPTDTVPPPPYTARASDPLPAWAASTARLRDLTATTPALSQMHVPLDPPPSFFSTPSPRRIRTRSFEPFTIPSRSRTSADGFVLLYTDELRSHGISPDDWMRFLQDLQVAARLATQGLGIRGEPPRTTGLGVGSMRGRVYDAQFSKTPLEQVQDLMEVYNECAWERRKVRVTLKVNSGNRGLEGYGILVEAL